MGTFDRPVPLLLSSRIIPLVTKLAAMIIASEERRNKCFPRELMDPIHETKRTGGTKGERVNQLSFDVSSFTVGNRILHGKE